MEVKIVVFRDLGMIFVDGVKVAFGGAIDWGENTAFKILLQIFRGDRAAADKLKALFAADFMTRLSSYPGRMEERINIQSWLDEKLGRQKQEVMVQGGLF